MNRDKKLTPVWVIELQIGFFVTFCLLFTFCVLLFATRGGVIVKRELDTNILTAEDSTFIENEISKCNYLRGTINGFKKKGTWFATVTLDNVPELFCVAYASKDNIDSLDVGDTVEVWGNMHYNSDMLDGEGGLFVGESAVVPPFRNHAYIKVISE